MKKYLFLFLLFFPLVSHGTTIIPLYDPGALRQDGSEPLTGDWDVNNYDITNIEDVCATGIGRFDGGVGIGTDPGLIYPLQLTMSSLREDAGVKLENTAEGDITVRFVIGGGAGGGGADWVIGIDNSDGDSFKIARDTELQTFTALAIDTSRNFNFQSGNFAGIGTVACGDITGGTYNDVTISGVASLLTLSANAAADSWVVDGDHSVFDSGDGFGIQGGSGLRALIVTGGNRTLDQDVHNGANVTFGTIGCGTVTSTGDIILTQSPTASILAPSGLNDILRLGATGGSFDHYIDFKFNRFSSVIQVLPSTALQMNADLAFPDGYKFKFGNGAEAFFRFRGSVNNDHLQLALKVNDANHTGHLVILEESDFASANRIPSATANPTLRIYSSDATQANDYIEVSHNQDDGVIATGAGNIRLNPAGNVIIGGTTPDSLFEVDGAEGLAIETVTGNTTLDKTHSTVLVNASGNVTITLAPAADTYNNTDGIGRIQTVVKIDADADTVTLDPTGAEEINFAPTAVITVQGESITFQSNGTAYFIL